MVCIRNELPEEDVEESTIMTFRRCLDMSKDKGGLEECEKFLWTPAGTAYKHNVHTMCMEYITLLVAFVLSTQILPPAPLHILKLYHVYVYGKQCGPPSEQQILIATLCASVVILWDMPVNQ